MRRNKSFFAVALLAAVFSMSACTMMPSARNKSSKPEEIEQVQMPEAYQIYQLYLSSGGTMTYEEWLESVRGNKGDPGHSPVVTIGNNGHWYIDGKDTGINAQGEQGEQGAQGEKGDTGDKGNTGKSAYEQYLEAHPDYTKSEEEWLDDLLNGRLGVQTSHTVSFNTNGGGEIASQTIYHGEKASKPADPVKAGYTFEGWYYNNEPWSFVGHVVTSDMVIEARWKAIDYVAIFYNDDGTILDQQDNVHYGDRLVYQGEDPIKPNPEDHYLYTFAGWDKELTVDGDMVFTAQYSKEYAPYEERYVDAEGNQLFSRFYLTEDSSNKFVFNNKILEKEDGRFYLEAEDAELSEGLQPGSGSGHGGASVGYLDGGRYMRYRFNLTYKMTALLYTTVSNTYSRINELMTITINGKELVIEDDVQAPGTWMWDMYQEALVGKAYFQEGENEILVTCKCGGYNTDYIALEDLGFDITQEGIDVPTKANEGTLKYQFCDWELLSDDNNTMIYGPVFETCTVGLEFNKTKVDVYHGTAKNVIVPARWDGYDITSVGRQCFVGTNVESVQLPETITLICESAFFDVDTLKSINFPSNLTKIEGYAFQGCYSLEHINLNEGLTSLGNHAFDSVGLKEIILPSTLTFIDDNAFVNVKAEYVYIPATVEEIRWYAFGTYDLNNAITIFCEREYRPSTYEGEWAKGNAVIWGYKSVVEENGYKFAISEVEGETCATLISIDATVVDFELPATINGVPVTAMAENALRENSRVKTVVLPSFVTDIPARMFHGCSSLESITLHDNVTSIGEDAFGGCKKLLSFDMPDSVTTIGRALFGDCYSLQSVKLSKNITELTDQMFVNCDNLQFVDIPDSVTFISSRAFDNCEILTSVTMSASIETIENKAFTYSWNISKVFCKCTEEKWNAIMAVYTHDYDNLYLATAYFYSETTPSEAGNYWHYVDGVPTIW